MNNKLINSFRGYQRIVENTCTGLPSYISIVNSLVHRHNVHTKYNYVRYNHVSNHSRITQIYTNLRKNK